MQLQVHWQLQLSSHEDLRIIAIHLTSLLHSTHSRGTPPVFVNYKSNRFAASWYPFILFTERYKPIALSADVDTQHNCTMWSSLTIACEIQVCIIFVLISVFFSGSDEVDIIPCLHCQEKQNNEREDPIIVVNHKLGIKSWCIKPLFLFAYKKLMRSHKCGEKNCNLSGTVHYFPLGIIIGKETQP